MAEVVTQTGADVMSVSYGIPEYALRADRTELDRLHGAFQLAADKGVTVFVASGDHGAAPPVGPRGARERTVSWPAADPSAVAVGGTRLHLGEAGERTSPDTVWDGVKSLVGGSAVYRLAARRDPRTTGVIDTTKGRDGVDGYEAGPGYDLASGGARSTRPPSYPRWPARSGPELLED